MKEFCPWSPDAARDVVKHGDFRMSGDFFQKSRKYRDDKGRKMYYNAMD